MEHPDELAKDNPRGEAGLADDPATGRGATPDAADLAAGGPRGDGLADDAAPEPDATPGDVGEDQPRGDGLAEDA